MNFILRFITKRSVSSSESFKDKVQVQKYHWTCTTTCQRTREVACQQFTALAVILGRWFLNNRNSFKKEVVINMVGRKDTKGILYWLQTTTGQQGLSWLPKILFIFFLL